MPMAERTAAPAPRLPAAAGAPAGGLHDATLADWIAVVAGALGALMATLDISITNSALPQIQGEIGATGTEGTWISTGYLMTENIVNRMVLLNRNERSPKTRVSHAASGIITISDMR
jgi:DHA2 family multidrug resistance protein